MPQIIRSGSANRYAIVAPLYEAKRAGDRKSISRTRQRSIRYLVDNGVDTMILEDGERARTGADLRDHQSIIA